MSVYSQNSLPSTFASNKNETIYPSCDLTAVRQYQAFEQAEIQRQNLENGAGTARKLLNEHMEKICKTGEHVHQFNKGSAALVASLALALGGVPAIVGTCLVAGVAAVVHYFNGEIISANQKGIQTALKSLDVCIDAETDKELKREHYRVLLNTAHTIKRWEKAGKLFGMACGIAMCHTNEFVAIGMETKELVYDEFIMKACLENEPHKPSESLTDALVDMAEGMGLHNATESMRFQATAPQKENNVWQKAKTIFGM